MGLGDVSLTGFLFYLFLANLTLAIFNLLPAFPMDGGRILRAGVTPFVGRQGATTFAVAIGVTLGVLIGIMGLISGEYLIVLVMVFVILAAFAEGRAVRLEESMRRLRVGQFAVWDRGGVSPDDPIAMALRQGAHDLAVTDNGQLVGMIWRQQLVDAMSHGGLQRKISEIMDRRFVVISSDTSVHEAQRIMNESEPMDHPGCRWWNLPRSLHGRPSRACPASFDLENTRAAAFFAALRRDRPNIPRPGTLNLHKLLHWAVPSRSVDRSPISPYDLFAPT